ncbi:TD and POZ domain-containing protein 1-like [Cydia amplana]|uniref:TD and POZ domain-containing protein 1-like n=1 Tax=Cydia amplana TaxID=1869771 RepID=UPI002FE588FE
MPIAVKVKEQQLGSLLKLTCIVSLCHENAEPGMEKISADFNANDLAMVNIKFECNKKIPLNCSILARNHEKAKDCKIKVKVSCQETDEPCYLEWICEDQYKLIGGRWICDVSLNNMHTSMWNINITANKVEESFLTNFYNDIDFTDFNLSALDGSVAVHRAYLAAHSDVFRAMLRKEWKEATEGCVQIDGVTRQTLQHLKDYMYLRTLPDVGLEPLLLLASYYLMDDLKEQCVSKLALNCTSKEWSSLLEFAAVNKISELISGLMLNPSAAVQKQKEKELEDKA